MLHFLYLKAVLSLFQSNQYTTPLALLTPIQYEDRDVLQAITTKFPNLTTFCFDSREHFKYDTLVELMPFCKKLTTFQGPVITDSEFRALLNNARELEKLFIPLGSGISQKTLLEVRYPATLDTFLTPNFAPQDDRHEEILGKIFTSCPKLKSFSFQVAGAGNISLTNSLFPTSLEQLRFSKRRTNKQEIQNIIQRCPNLTLLSLHAQEIQPGLFSREGIVMHEKLQELSICALPIDHTDLEAIAVYFPNLTKLNLSSCQNITPQGFEELQLPHTLEELNISWTHCSDQGLRNIVASCPELKILNLRLCTGMSRELISELRSRFRILG